MDPPAQAPDGSSTPTLSLRTQSAIIAILATYLAGAVYVSFLGVQRARQCARRRRRMRYAIDALRHAAPPDDLHALRRRAGCDAVLVVNQSECAVLASDGMHFDRGDVLKHTPGGEGEHRDERPFHVVLEKASRGGGFVALRLLDKQRDEKRMAVMYANALKGSRALVGIVWDR